MELNGIANIKLLTDQMDDLLEEDKSQFGEWATIADRIKEQLNNLERYMLAVQDHIDSAEVVTNNGTVEAVHLKSLPHWHEVLQNPKKFPTLRERIDEQRSEKEAVDR